MISHTQNFITCLGEIAVVLTEQRISYTARHDDCQGGGTVTQLPAEQYQSGSTPDLGFISNT
jgi:hypothetical protein